MPSFIPPVFSGSNGRRFVAIAAVVSSFMCASRPDASAQAIVAIGDSITAGGYPLTSPGLPPWGLSYRDPLTRLLNGETIGTSNPTGTVYDVTMVGTLATNWHTDSTLTPGYLLNDPLFTMHAGYYGWRTEQVNEVLPTTFTPFNADIALVYLGTNDALQETPLATTKTAFSGILTTLQSAGVSNVFVAQIGPLGGGNAIHNPAIDAINAFIGGELSTQFNFHIVNLTAQDPWTHLTWDRIHPSEAGERLIAEAFFNSMVSANVLSAIPEPSTYAAILGVMALGGTMVVRRRRKGARHAA
ncbi:hypothetical protein ASA1KI_42480 [Opitutales bacterium ASA1]|uniref:GDSL-type esterase/lipase family protein n=1 Tax=Congregicoccus parvus TaxID=3081749 RepID=UPI002B294674|nr:hypothetical protein ASA1KI_42480 [Opitutales bacterium ASA1]